MGEASDVQAIVENHEKRITQLETNYGEVVTKMSDMEKGQLGLSNTVLKEFSSTKEMLVKQNERNDTLLEQMYGIKTLKITSRKDIIIGVVGGTGIVGGAVTILTLVVTNWDTIKTMFGGN